MIQKTEPTFWVEIYSSGSIDIANNVCSQDVLEFPLCVTLTPTKFIYTGGQEHGFVVGLINYPRFPSSPEDLWIRATQLADKLLEACHQHSILIMSPEKTEWISKRDLT